MKKSLIAAAVLTMVAHASQANTNRARTRDVSFTFRMGAGFPGDINRTHPFSAIPGLMDSTDKVRLYGDPAIINTTAGTYRGFKAGDTITAIAGVLVRPYPIQQTTGGMSASIGAATPPDGPAVIDVLEDGYIMVKCNDFAAAPCAKGGKVYVRIAATSGNKIQGGFHAASDTTNTLEITNAQWHSSPDQNGVAELRVWKERQ